MESQLNADNRYSDFEVDVDWYLNNGYMTLENMKKSIECGNYNEHGETKGQTL